MPPSLERTRSPRIPTSRIRGKRRRKNFDGFAMRLAIGVIDYRNARERKARLGRTPVLST
jgi:hypothetical protein